MQSFADKYRTVRPPYGRKMRIAAVDLNFSWPPNGGADVDLYHVLCGLQDAAFDVCLFGLQEKGSSDRGVFDPGKLPFPAQRVPFPHWSGKGPKIAAAMRKAVDRWEPDVVFITHGYALKPWVASALAHHRTIGRYYAHELTCARDAFRFKDGLPCPNDYLRNPEVCRACALAHQKTSIRSGRWQTWTVDYLAARAFTPEYHPLLLESLRSMNAVIVSNQDLKKDLDGFHEKVVVFPGGVNDDGMSPKPMPHKGPRDKKIVLMSGRAEDPAKGLKTLFSAGHLLEGRRNDFEIWATHFDHTESQGWFKALGWRDAASMQAVYALCDVCVVPSIWNEPFGLVAVEAMAAGRPVCASAVGGLQDIVRHADTGFLFGRGDYAELAKELEILLDNYPLRVRMGDAGRRIVEQEYRWKRIIERHYIPLIEEIIG